MTTKRVIPYRLLSEYTQAVDTYFVLHEGESPPADLEVFRANAERAGAVAMQRGELDDLRAAIDFVLAHDDAYLDRALDVSLSELMQSENAQDEIVLKRILELYRTVIWPDAEPVPSGGPMDVELVRMPLQEWRDRR